MGETGEPSREMPDTGCVCISSIPCVLGNLRRIYAGGGSEMVTEGNATEGREMEISKGD